MNCRITYIIDEYLGNNSELKSILLKFFSRSGPCRIKLKIQVSGSQHETFQDFLKRSLKICCSLPFRIDRQHLGCDAVPAQ